MPRNRCRYEFGPFELNPHEGTLLAAGEPVALAPKPFDVLRLLVERHGHVVLKSELMGSIWPDTAVEDANLTVSISVLRKALACRQPGSEYIETIPKRGYRFVEQVREIAEGEVDVVNARLFIGREREQSDLQNALRTAADGTATLFGISGEPGIGKTSLVEHFIDRTRDADEECFAARGRCLEHLAGVDAYLPVLQALNDLIGNHEDLVEAMKEFAPTWYGAIEMDDSVGIPSAPSSPFRTTPDQLHRELSRFLQRAACIAPLVLFIDDLHWADVSTIGLLEFLANRFSLDSARILIVAAYRPSVLLADAHPFLALQRQLQARGIGKEITLNLLSRHDIDQYVSMRFPRNQFSASFVDAISSITEGNPLLMVDLIRDLIRRGVLAQHDDTWILSGALPAWQSDLPWSVRAMVEHTIRQLDACDRSLLSAATLQGLEFDCSILAETLGADPAEIGERLDALSAIHGIVLPVRHASRRDDSASAHFKFVHALHREALHCALSPTRRALLSGTVAHATLEHHRDHVTDVASTLVLLFEEAHDQAQASEYALVAAQHAARMSGYREAIAFARRGLAFLESVPVGAEHAYKRLMLLVTLAMALGAVDGYGAPEVYEAYRGARELCRDTFDWLHLVPIVIGLWSFHASRGEFDQAQRLGSELLAMADEADAPGLLARGHVMHGGALAHLGYLPEARIELEQARAESDAHADSCPFILDVRVHTLCERSELLAVMGYMDQALSSAQEALALAHRLDSPYNITFAVFFCSVIRRRRGEAVEALKSADAAIEQALRHGFLDALSWATGLRSWALCHSGRVAEGISAIDGALASTRRMGPNVARSVTGHPGRCVLERPTTSGRPCCDRRSECRRTRGQILPVGTQSLARRSAEVEGGCESEAKSRSVLPPRNQSRKVPRCKIVRAAGNDAAVRSAERGATRSYSMARAHNSLRFVHGRVEYAGPIRREKVA